MVTLIVLNYNDPYTTIGLVRSVEPYDSISHIVLVDNASSDDSLVLFDNANFSEKVIILNAQNNGGYGAGNNIGIRYSYEVLKSEYILICNPDVLFDEMIIPKLIAGLNKLKNVAAIAPIMKYPSGQITKSYWDISSAYEYTLFSLFFIGRLFRRVDAIEKKHELIMTECIAGSLLFARTEVLYKYALYDEDIFLYCEETVQGIMLKRAGYRLAIDPEITFLHNHSVSINKSIPKELDRYKAQWKSRLFVLRKYYSMNGIQMFWAKVVRNICIIERSILLRLK